MRPITMFAVLLLASCGSPNDARIGEISRNEAEALNDAAQMIEANNVEPANAN